MYFGYIVVMASAAAMRVFFFLLCVREEKHQGRRQHNDRNAICRQKMDILQPKIPTFFMPLGSTILSSLSLSVCSFLSFGCKIYFTVIIIKQYNVYWWYFEVSLVLFFSRSIFILETTINREKKKENDSNHEKVGIILIQKHRNLKWTENNEIEKENYDGICANFLFVSLFGRRHFDVFSYYHFREHRALPYDICVYMYVNCL